jgi:alpha-D-glucose phosphate-specific phosphoglucomutase
MRIKFGTDGWRGVISRDFTFANVRRVVWAIASFLEETGAATRGVAVAYDRRFLSDQYAAEAAGVLAARGIPVRLGTESLPTPVLSWAVRDQGLAGGIMVTASHNPPEWNGVKFKEPFGGSARSIVNERIEGLLQEAAPEGERVSCLDLPECRKRGLLEDLRAWDGYAAGVRHLIDFDGIRRANLRVAVDVMHGTGSPWLARLLKEAGCRVAELHGESNPGFRGVAPEPVEAKVPDLMALVAREGFHLGLVNDGDADRVGAVDERGRYFSSQRILAVFARYLREEKGLPGDLAKTVSATSMLDLLADRYGLELILTPVGFRHIGEVMLERQILVGGEESGGIGISAHLPDRDGVLNALLLAEIVAKTGKGLRQYVQSIFDDEGYFTYRRVDVPIAPAAAEAVRKRVSELGDLERLAGMPVRRVITLDGMRFEREDHSWLLVRPSGTEPLLRIYAEARSRQEVEALLAQGERLAGL